VEIRLAQTEAAVAYTNSRQAAEVTICYVSVMEARLDALEIRYTHLERLVDELSQVIFGQQKLIDRLSAEVTLLRNNVSGTTAPSERPPHY
jgi:SlyX protein